MNSSNNQESSGDDQAGCGPSPAPMIGPRDGAPADLLPLPKPPWIRVRAPASPGYQKTRDLIEGLRLHTVCQEASCPNIGDCWSQGHATVMILGAICTRACAFCNVATGKPDLLDPDEPYRVAEACAALGLKHIVITSVDRDDLADGGAGHFAACIGQIRSRMPGTSIEVLTPDFLGKPGAAETVAAARPDVYNHNLETVPRLYPTVRPGARYFQSVRLLADIKKSFPTLFTKSGLMVGLGESRSEVMQVMDDLRVADVDFLTIGQYLRPSSRHIAVSEYVAPKRFEEYARLARARGFLMVSSSPMTRSSFHAGADFARLVEQRRQSNHPSQNKNVGM